MAFGYFTILLGPGSYESWLTLVGIIAGSTPVSDILGAWLLRELIRVQRIETVGSTPTAITFFHCLFCALQSYREELWGFSAIDEASHVKS